MLQRTYHNLADHGPTSAEQVRLWVQLLIALLVARLIYRILIYPGFVSPLRHLPGPKNNHYLLGQLVNQYRASTPTQLFQEWSSQWPDSPFIRFKGLANSDMLLVNTVEAHRQVLQTCGYDFQKPGFFARLVGEIAGTGLLFAEADDHKRQRRFVQKVFTPQNLRKLSPVFQCKAKELTTYLSSFLERSGEHEIEVQSIFTKATLDIIGVTTLGVELENLRTPDVKLDFLSCYNRMIEQSKWSALISFVNVQVPIRRWVPLEANRGFVRASNAVREILKECIRERMQAMLKHHDSGQRETIARDLSSYSIGERISGKSELSDEQILGHLMNFLSAGAMTWAVYPLATNQEIQDLLYAETRELCFNIPAQNYAIVDRLPYLHNFVRELLRLYSPEDADPEIRERYTDIPRKLVPNFEALEKMECTNPSDGYNVPWLTLSCEG
ncbi:hypothetical protein JX266_014078 [Neoarthrinium moseri]|nr:hypothetical protein JX266_014078 [Neoarthrinium moseri]